MPAARQTRGRLNCAGCRHSCAQHVKAGLASRGGGGQRPCFPGHRTWFGPGIPTRLVRGGLTGAATAFVVLLALCQSPVRNLGRDQVQGPCCPTGSPTTPPSLPSCGWLRPTPSSSCASVRRAAATTASLAVECRPTRPVRADPPPKTIRTITATGTTTITQAAEDLINQRCVEACPADAGCIIQPVAHSLV